jgi:predicted phage tail protein
MSDNKKRKIYLYGALAKRGAMFEFDVKTAGEAVRALCVNFPDLQAEIASGAWHVVRGQNIESGFYLEEEDIASMNLGKGDLHILPVIIGAKNNVAKVVLGAALVAASLGTFGFASALATPISGALFGATTWGNMVGMLGLSMAAGGISQMLAPETKSSDETKSSLFSNLGVTGAQGSAVPIVYGELIVPGVLISAGLDVQNLDIE